MRLNHEIHELCDPIVTVVILNRVKSPRLDRTNSYLSSRMVYD